MAVAVTPKQDNINELPSRKFLNIKGCAWWYSVYSLLSTNLMKRTRPTSIIWMCKAWNILFFGATELHCCPNISMSHSSTCWHDRLLLRTHTLQVILSQCNNLQLEILPPTNTSEIHHSNMPRFIHESLPVIIHAEPLKESVRPHVIIGRNCRIGLVSRRRARCVCLCVWVWMWEWTGWLTYWGTKLPSTFKNPSRQEQAKLSCQDHTERYGFRQEKLDSERRIPGEKGETFLWNTE